MILKVYDPSLLFSCYIVVARAVPVRFFEHADALDSSFDDNTSVLGNKSVLLASYGSRNGHLLHFRTCRIHKMCSAE